MTVLDFLTPPLIQDNPNSEDNVFPECGSSALDNPGLSYRDLRFLQTV